MATKADNLFVFRNIEILVVKADFVHTTKATSNEKLGEGIESLRLSANDLSPFVDISKVIIN